MWRRTATGPEAPPFGMGIGAFGIGPASRFATEHPALRLKCKPRVESPASAGLFFTFPAAKQAPDSNPASFDPLVGTRHPRADALGKSGESAGVERHLAHHPRRQPHSARSVPSILVVEQVSDRSGLVRLARPHLLLGFVCVVRRQRLPAGLPALRRRRICADRRDLEGSAQYQNISTKAIGPRRMPTTTSRRAS